MDDPIPTVIGTICVAALLALAFMFGKADVAMDCRAMGMTKIDRTVFECRVKEDAN